MCVPWEKIVITTESITIEKRPMPPLAIGETDVQDENGGEVTGGGGLGLGTNEHTKHDYCLERLSWFEYMAAPLLETLSKTQVCAAAALAVRISKLGVQLPLTLRAIELSDESIQRTINCYVRQQRLEDIDLLRKCVCSAFYMRTPCIAELSGALFNEFDLIAENYVSI